MTNVLDTIFTTADNGTYNDLTADAVAERFGVTIEEADMFIESLITIGMVGEDWSGDLYNMDERMEYEDEMEAEEEDWQQYLIDREIGYAIAC